MVFEVDLLKSQEINLDYILELIFEQNKKTKNKDDLIDEVRRVIRASIGSRAKESLIVDFINQTNLDDIGEKANVIDAFFTFAQAEQKRESEELIQTEALNQEEARRYLKASQNANMLPRPASTHMPHSPNEPTQPPIPRSARQPDGSPLFLKISYVGGDHF